MSRSKSAGKDAPAAPNAREALIEATIVALDRFGPVGVRTQDVCAELGVSKALVNYHFGGREGLIAEAVAVGYERYVDELWAAASTATGGPSEQLLAWIDAQVDWTQRHPGVAMVLNFPRFLSGEGSHLPPDVLDRIRTAGTQNHANLRSLVAAVRAAARGKRRAAAVDIEDERALSALVGWATLGMSVWSAGEHLPTHGLRREQFSSARTILTRRLVGLISE